MTFYQFSKIFLKNCEFQDYGSKFNVKKNSNSSALCERLSLESGGRNQTPTYREWPVRMSTWIKIDRTFSGFPECLDSDASIETDSYSYEWFAASRGPLVESLTKSIQLVVSEKRIKFKKMK